MNDKIDFDKLMAEAREKDIAKVKQLIIDGAPAQTARETTVETEYTFDPAIMLPNGHVVRDEYGLIISKISVKITTYEEDGDEYVTMRSFGVPATANGKVNKRATPVWRYLPADLAKAVADIH